MKCAADTLPNDTSKLIIKRENRILDGFIDLLIHKCDNRIILLTLLHDHLGNHQVRLIEIYLHGRYHLPHGRIFRHQPDQILTAVFKSVQLKLFVSDVAPYHVHDQFINFCKSRIGFNVICTHLLAVSDSKLPVVNNNHIVKWLLVSPSKVIILPEPECTIAYDGFIQEFQLLLLDKETLNGFDGGSTFVDLCYKLLLIRDLQEAILLLRTNSWQGHKEENTQHHNSLIQGSHFHLWIIIQLPKGSKRKY